MRSTADSRGRLARSVLPVALLMLAGGLAGCGPASSSLPGDRAKAMAHFSDHEYPVASTGPTEPGGNPPRFGVAVSKADPALVAEIERRAGSEVGMFRVFARWDTPFPNAAHRELLASGRPLHLSIRPRTDDGEVVAWADVAAAEPGSPVHDRLVAWAEAIAPFGSQLYVTFNHEPETSDSAANGTALEFVAAWRRAVEVFDEHGAGHVPTVLVLGRGAYADGSIGAWYPGDDVVDVIGVDAYNWYDCQGTNRPWADPGALLAPALAFAADHDKPLAVPEIASTEDDEMPGRKAQWIDDLSVVVADAARRQPIEFVAWFSVHDRTWPLCQWEHDSSAEASAALGRAIDRFAIEPSEPIDLGEPVDFIEPGGGTDAGSSDG